MKTYTSIETGDIGLVRRELSWNPVSWISAAIRLMTGCRYNHAVLFVVTTSAQIFVVEAVETGVQMITLSRWLKKYKHELKVIRPLQKKPHNIQSRILSYLGTPYDYTSLFIHQLKFQIARWFSLESPKWYGRTDKTGAEKKLYCSELAALVYDWPKWYTYTTADVMEEPHVTIYQSLKNYSNGKL